MLYLLPQAIDRAVERFPEREAVCFPPHSLHYTDLVRQANGLARLLIAEGVRRGDRVGIYMDKSLESVVALYGIMKAGAAYVPLDPFAPLARLTYVIRDCGIRHLITKKEKLPRLRQITAETTSLRCLIGLEPVADLSLCCIGWDEIHALSSDAPPDVNVIEQDLAYILYTSGSTGVPKGIMHTHRSGLNFALWAVQTYDLRAEDRLSNHAPLHFDLSTFDFFAGALAGAATVIISETVSRFPASVSELMADERLTVWYSVPFALAQLLLYGVLEERDLTRLRWVLFAGEPFPVKHLQALLAKLAHVRFSNLYGPTETNVCTYYHVPQVLAEPGEPLPIGKACANTEVLVVDDDDRPVADGEIGELLVRGPIVMGGYWGRPDLNQKAFFRHSLYPHRENLFYRTGDLVQLKSDGTYKFLGRKDRQVKVRGYRIELDEVESALLLHEQVQEAAVYSVPHELINMRLEAVVVPKRGTQVASPILVKHLSQLLPKYAIPDRIMITDALPRTSTGKVDWQALKALSGDES